MAATVEINEHNGAGPTKTVKTNDTVFFRGADVSEGGLDNPIVKPDSGSAFSYEKALRLEIIDTDGNTITNPRAFSDGANGLGTGVTMSAGIQDGASYSQPVNTDSAIATTDFFSFTSGSPLAIDQIVGGPFAAPGDIADFLYMQADVADTATSGLTPTETLTIAYDET